MKHSTKMAELVKVSLWYLSTSLPPKHVGLKQAQEKGNQTLFFTR